MKILLDECVNRELVRDLAGLDVTTVRDAGWPGRKNGELPSLAAAKFDLFVTVDRNLTRQNTFEGRHISIVVLASRSGRLNELRALVPRLRAALATLGRGGVIVLE